MEHQTAHAHTSREMQRGNRRPRTPIICGSRPSGHLEARNGVDPGVLGDLFGADLVPHALDRARRRAHEGNPGPLASLGEGGVLAQEAIPGRNQIAQLRARDSQAVSRYAIHYTRRLSCGTRGHRTTGCGNSEPPGGRPCARRTRGRNASDAPPAARTVQPNTGASACPLTRGNGTKESRGYGHRDDHQEHPRPRGLPPEATSATSCVGILANLGAGGRCIENATHPKNNSRRRMSTRCLANGAHPPPLTNKPAGSLPLYLDAWPVRFRRLRLCHAGGNRDTPHVPLARGNGAGGPIREDSSERVRGRCREPTRAPRYAGTGPGAPRRASSSLVQSRSLPRPRTRTGDASTAR